MQSFAQQVRDIIQQYDKGRQFTVQDIALVLDYITAKEKQPIYTVLRDMTKSKEVEKVVPGTYRLVEKKAIRPAEKRRKMWTILRARRTVTAEDMVLLAGVTDQYAKEFLRALHRQKVVRRIDQPNNKPAKWQMIADPVKMPLLDDTAAKLRAIRAARKRAVSAIDHAAKSMIGATQAMSELKTALVELPEVADDDL